MHIGIEVEGRFKGVKTLFITHADLLYIDKRIVLSDNSLNFDAELRILMQNCYNHNCSQIQFYLDSSSIYNDIMFNPVIKDFADAGLIITFDVFKLTVQPPPYVNVMLTLDYGEYPDFWYLKETDQIKFNRDRTVKLIPLENMYTARPEDFENDVPVETQK